MDSLPVDVIRSVCLFLDAKSLVMLDQTHKCEWTDVAWAHLLSTRLQFSLVNRVEFLSNPKAAMCVNLEDPEDLEYHYQNTQDLLYQTQAWANVFGRLAYKPQTESHLNPLLIALSKTSPLQGPIDHVHFESHQLDKEWAEICYLSHIGLGRYITRLQFYQERGVFYRQWRRIRELAQRGIVHHASFLKELRVGDEICHAVVHVYEGSLCGLRQLKKEHMRLRIQNSRVDAVCNGVVQFRSYLDLGSGQSMRQVGWAARCDMLISDRLMI